MIRSHAFLISAVGEHPSPRVVGAPDAGAQPFELEQALRNVMDSGSYFGPRIAQKLLQRTEHAAEDELTSRQLEILKLIADGKSAKEIAYDLGLSVKTIETHRAQIMDRLNIHDVAGLVRFAVRVKLVSVDS